MASQPKATPDESIWLGLKGSHYLFGCVFGFVGMETSEEAEEGFVIFSCPSADPGYNTRFKKTSRCGWTGYGCE